LREPILVVHEHAAVRSQLQRILCSSLHAVHAADTLQAARDVCEHNRPALMIVPAGSLAALGEFRAETATEDIPCVACLPASASPAELRDMLLSTSSNNFLGTHAPLSEELPITVGKLTNGDIFGLKKYLAWGAETETRRLLHSGERGEFVRWLRDSSRLWLGRRFSDLCAVIADELLSNALFNAPIDGDGQRPFADKSRTGSRALSSEDAVEIEYGGDGRFFGIAVSDPFGSLDRDRVLAHLVKALAPSDEFSVRFDTGGAGAGLAMVYRNCQQLIFNVAAGQRTEVIALVDIRQRPSSLRTGVGSLNLFYQPRQGQGGRPC
jgi:CheY-like chemotaxis protein